MPHHQWTFSSGTCRWTAAIALVVVTIGCTPKPNQKSLATTTRSAAKTVATTSPATRPSIKVDIYSHHIKAETVFLYQGKSDPQIVYDTIPAGAHVTAVGLTRGYVNVHTDDGRDGLVLVERLDPPFEPALELIEESGSIRPWEPYQPAEIVHETSGQSHEGEGFHAVGTGLPLTPQERDRVESTRRAAHESSDASGTDIDKVSVPTTSTADPNTNDEHTGK